MRRQRTLRGAGGSWAPDAGRAVVRGTHQQVVVHGVPVHTVDRAGVTLKHSDWLLQLDVPDVHLVVWDTQHVTDDTHGQLLSTRQSTTQSTNTVN